MWLRSPTGLRWGLRLGPSVFTLPFSCVPVTSPRSSLIGRASPEEPRSWDWAQDEGLLLDGPGHWEGVPISPAHLQSRPRGPRATPTPGPVTIPAVNNPERGVLSPRFTDQATEAEAGELRRPPANHRSAGSSQAGHCSPAPARGQCGHRPQPHSWLLLPGTLGGHEEPEDRSPRQHDKRRPGDRGKSVRPEVPRERSAAPPPGPQEQPHCQVCDSADLDCPQGPQVGATGRTGTLQRWGLREGM